MRYRCTQSLVDLVAAGLIFVCERSAITSYDFAFSTEYYMKGTMNRLLCSHWLHVSHDYTICLLFIIYTFQNTYSEKEKAISL